MSIDFDNMPPAIVGYIASYSYGNNWYATATPLDRRKSKTFGPQLSKDAVERIAEEYLEGKVI